MHLQGDGAYQGIMPGIAMANPGPDLERTTVPRRVRVRASLLLAERSTVLNESVDSVSADSDQVVQSAMARSARFGQQT